MQEPQLLPSLEAAQQPQPAASLASTAMEGGAMVLELPAVVAASASTDASVEEVGTAVRSATTKPQRHA